MSFGFIHILILGFVDFIIQLIFNGLLQLIHSALKSFVEGPDVLKFSFMKVIFTETKTIGFAILGLIVSYQTFKSMFAYLGFEAEAPLVIAGRALAFGFLVLTSDQIAEVVLGMSSSIVKGFLSMAPGQFAIDNVQPFAFITDPIRMILTPYIIIKYANVVVKFAERYMIGAFLILVSPIAFACGAGKSTQSYFQGWCRVFMGNIVIQLFQSILFVATIMFMNNDLTGFNWFSKTLLTIALLRVVEKIEDITQQATIAAGVDRNSSAAVNVASDIGYYQNAINNFKKLMPK